MLLARRSGEIYEMGMVTRRHLFQIPIESERIPILYITSIHVLEIDPISGVSTRGLSFVHFTN